MQWVNHKGKVKKPNVCKIFNGGKEVAEFFKQTHKEKEKHI